MKPASAVRKPAVGMRPPRVAPSFLRLNPEDDRDARTMHLAAIGDLDFDARARAPGGRLELASALGCSDTGRRLRGAIQPA